MRGFEREVESVRPQSHVRRDCAAISTSPKISTDRRGRDKVPEQSATSRGPHCDQTSRSM